MELRQLYLQRADYKDKFGMLFNGDCIKLLKDIPDESVDMVLTDIPYDGVSRGNSGLLKMIHSDKEMPIYLLLI